MPPKGWRKNADGQYPQPSKDQEYVSIDELLFPRSVVQRLAKQILNEDSANMSLSKDSLLALQRSATVFVSHVMFHARLLASEADRKTVNVQDVVGALERSEYGGFVPEVKNQVSLHENEARQKKQRKVESRAAAVEGGDSDSAAKKLKDNNEVAHTRVDSDLEDTVDQTEDTEDAEQDDTKEEDESGDENEPVAVNPISVLGKDEDELHGEEPHQKSEEEDEDDDDEES